MATATEGYILHTYGAERYLRHAVASVFSLRRYDRKRPVAIFAPPEHEAILHESGANVLFQEIHELPEYHRSIVGFKNHISKFMVFDRCLFLDSDMLWCRDPDPLWLQLSGYSFTVTGLDKADFFFGGPKSAGILADYIFDRRRTTMRRFNLTNLPRVQAGLIYSQDKEYAQLVSKTALLFLKQQEKTHFRSRLNEGRNEESCEWSMAMAMSRLKLPVFPWFQGTNSPQLDYISGMTKHDPEFKNVVCRFFSDRFVYSLRGLKKTRIRNAAINFFSSIPGKGDYYDVTPFLLHFGWLHYKKPFFDFAAKTWDELTQTRALHLHSMELIDK